MKVLEDKLKNCLEIRTKIHGEENKREKIKIEGQDQEISCMNDISSRGREQRKWMGRNE